MCVKTSFGRLHAHFFEFSCSAIDVMLPFLSLPIEAYGDSIDFYLERRALDPFVDGLPC